MPTYRDIVKQWYITGAKPTQAQFWTLFDDLRFIDEGIGIDDVAGLNDVLISKASQLALDVFTGGELISFNEDGSYDIPAGYLLEKMLIIPAADIDLKIGNTEGGEEIIAEESVTSDGEVFIINVFAKDAKTIYFSGITSITQIIFFKRKVTLS